MAKIIKNSASYRNPHQGCVGKIYPNVLKGWVNIEFTAHSAECDRKDYLKEDAFLRKDVIITEIEKLLYD